MQVKLTAHSILHSVVVSVSVSLSHLACCRPSWPSGNSDFYSGLQCALSIFTQTMTAGAAHKKYDNIILLTAKIFTRNRRDTERDGGGVRERERQHAGCTSCFSLLVMAIKVWQVLATTTSWLLAQTDWKCSHNAGQCSRDTCFNLLLIDKLPCLLFRCGIFVTLRFNTLNPDVVDQ